MAKLTLTENLKATDYKVGERICWSKQFFRVRAINEHDNSLEVDLEHTNRAARRKQYALMRKDGKI
jgi:hypothetical protein